MKSKQINLIGFTDVLGNIVKARKVLGLTQEEIAAEIGVCQQTYSKIENGKMRITMKLLQFLKKKKINIIWILFNEGEMFGRE